MPTTPESAQSTPPRHPSLLEATVYWLKLGCISFGGPAGQISLMHQELVEKRRWISERRFLYALNYAMLLPGPEAQQLATYLGWLLHGVRGGLIAGLLFILPAFLLMILLSWLYLVQGHQPLLQGVLYGIKPAVAALVVFAAWRIGSRILHNLMLKGIALAAFLLICVANLPFPLILLLAAITGLLGNWLAPSQFPDQTTSTSQNPSSAPALLDNHTPLSDHARFRPIQLLLMLMTGMALGGGLLAGLALTLGWQATLTQISWFFSKVALLSFGGAYAVLPYVYQGAVESHGWLTASQMMDGLALGESTPGPLILLVTFVGFIGGWTLQPLGADALLLAGILAASLATFFTFLPSFLFILVGAPLVEATRQQPRYTAPLTAITAAIVGVILNLAVFFAGHLLWPDGWQGRFDWMAALLGIAAFVALFRYKLGILPLLGGAAVLGILLHGLAT